MADIDVERREGAPMWLWLAGLALLALLIWAFFSMRGTDDADLAVVQDTTFAATETTRAATDVGAVPPAVTEYMSECTLDEGARPEAMGPEHEFTINCLERLANSIEAVAQQRPSDAGVGQHVEVIRRNVQQIRASAPTSTDHAQWTREAAIAGASALEGMHSSWHAGDAQIQSSITEVRTAAQQIGTKQLQLEQLGDLRSYFARAGDALNRVASASTR